MSRRWHGGFLSHLKRRNKSYPKLSQSQRRKIKNMALVFLEVLKKLDQVFHIFAFLKGHHNARLVFVPSYPVVDEKDYATKDWSGLYGEEKESVPPNAPKPLGKEFVMRAFVDASFVGCKMTRRPRTGFVVFLNCAPIYWMSKKQGSCEINTFGSEFVAMRTYCEYVRGIRYK